MMTVKLADCRRDRRRCSARSPADRRRSLLRRRGMLGRARPSGGHKKCCTLPIRQQPVKREKDDIWLRLPATWRLPLRGWFLRLMISFAP